jgi:uncharacterized membrane protein
MISSLEKMKNNITNVAAVSAIFAAAALAVGTFGIIAITTTPSAFAADSVITPVPNLNEKHINICSGFDPQCSNDDQEPPK